MTMTSNPKSISSLLSLRRTRRGRLGRTFSWLRAQARSCKAKRSFKISSKSTSGSKVPDKLEALKKLIPAHQNEETVKADQLFQQTAEYIVMLKAQVVILQKLIEFYGNATDNENAEL
ncbi:Transcription factor like [Quillaja saponaria]|uniref:Transcription factor like n=1 Tax=Quillaja saponaria TaxID=32244 RepID=A0AAD7Q406_QUISA|nr:Transcription factor like [Quillaja saponaria]